MIVNLYDLDLIKLLVLKQFYLNKRVHAGGICAETELNKTKVRNALLELATLGLIARDGHPKFFALTHEGEECVKTLDLNEIIVRKRISRFFSNVFMAGSIAFVAVLIIGFKSVMISSLLWLAILLGILILEND